MVNDDEIVHDTKRTATGYVHVEYVGESGPAFVRDVVEQYFGTETRPLVGGTDHSYVHVTI